MNIHIAAKSTEAIKYFPENKRSKVLILVAATYTKVNPKIRKGVLAVPMYGRFASK